MKLYHIQKYLEKGRVILSALVESSGFAKPQTLFYSYPEKYYDSVPVSADPFFPALLVPAMMQNEPLEVHASFSKKMMENQDIIQDVFSVWYAQKFNKIRIIANDLKEETAGGGNKNGTFFSLGVDSMYSMLKHLPQNHPAPGKELSSLVYMKGLELPLSDYCKCQDHDVIQCIEKVGSHYGLEVIAGETNLRDIFPLNWEGHYFGPGLAASALSLSNRFRNFFIPASHSYAILFHDPSSVLLDNLWSNEKTSIHHDGSEKDRVGKISGLITHDAFALDNLRVCVCNEGGCYNCGKCWKCIRTMITLQILNKLRQAASFPDELPDHYWMELRTYQPRSMVFTMENLELARKHGKKDIEKILQREIRVGNLDLFREGRSMGFLLSEFFYYLLIKTGKKLRVIK